MKKALTTALALAVISTSAIADEKTAQLYKNFYGHVNTYVDDSTPWKDTVLGWFSDGYANNKYGKQEIYDSKWITDDIKKHGSKDMMDQVYVLLYQMIIQTTINHMERNTLMLLVVKTIS